MTGLYQSNVRTFPNHWTISTVGAIAQVTSAVHLVALLECIGMAIYLGLPLER